MRFDPLVDVLVHTQDIVRPSGCSRPMPPQEALDVADYVWGKTFPYGAQRRLRGLRLNATDVDWTVGSGEAIAGPMGALLVVITGRMVAAELTGNGVAQLSVTT
ncbi:MAG: hypothetical protein ABJD68_02065 [Nakamurella sp.]